MEVIGSSLVGSSQRKHWKWRISIISIRAPHLRWWLAAKKLPSSWAKTGIFKDQIAGFLKKTYHLWQEIIIALNNHLKWAGSGRIPWSSSCQESPKRCCFCFFHIPILPYPWVDNSSRCQSFLSCQIDGFIKNNFELAGKFLLHENSYCGWLSLVFSLTWKSLTLLLDPGWWRLLTW